MKTWGLFAALSTLSCLIMIVVDFKLGPKAEFLNAYSVLERILGRDSSIADSMIASKFGEPGELIAVIIASSLIGAILTIAARACVGGR